MKINRTGHYSRFAILAATLLCVSVWGGLLAAPGTARASSAYQAQVPRVIVVPAHGTVSIKARGFCLDFSKDFPTGDMSATGLGADEVRNALNYAIEKGYADTNAQQVQIAIWFLRDGTWHNPDHAVAQEIVDNSKTSTPSAPKATALTDALAKGTVTVSAKFVPQTADAFYGDGDVVITNTTGSAVRVYMPVGVTFELPNGNGNFQNLLVYGLIDSSLPGTGSGDLGIIALTAIMTAIAMISLGVWVRGRSRA